MNQTKSNLLQEHYLDLTTTGRKTGKQRTAELSFYSEEGKVYLLAHKRDTGRLTDWAENLQANPKCEIKINGEKFDGVLELVAEDGELENFVRKSFEKKYGTPYYNSWYKDTIRVPLTIVIN